jgi:mono/diheme cytochrome c family protein
MWAGLSGCLCSLVGRASLGDEPRAAGALAQAADADRVASDAGVLPAAEAALPPAVARRVSFVADVQPILVTRCLGCHGPEKQEGGLRFDRRDAALEGGDSGPALVPGRSAESLLVHLASGLDPQRRMPAEGEPLSEEQVGVLRAWIDQGAEWPEGDVDPRRLHWAYQPLVPPPIPPVSRPDWVRNPVDAFILARLDELGLAPSPEADRRSLIRRLYFDLIGLPPAPEEINAFLADASPDAYERLVDRLLASPRYGERWARHWMDVVHFAETHGHDQDRPRPHAWPYRDYLIRSLNGDKPYDRFVMEQVAGDELYPDDPDGIVALGFLAAGPWDESSLLNIADDTVDKQIARYLDRDDMVTTTMATFTGTSVQCARCHDHKFDPVSQAEYYGLQAVFAGVDRANRPYDPDPRVARTRRALAALRAELERRDAATDALLLAQPYQTAAAFWEQQLAAEAVLWHVLSPVEFSAVEGSTAALQPDGSLLYGGPRPEKDTYTIVAHSPLEAITAVRLEVLADPSLPMQGPGRQDNGNLHLSEFRLEAAPLSDPRRLQTVLLRAATADFDQEGWTAAHAIDGQAATAWGIYPNVGRNHHVVFELAEPLRCTGGLLLRFTLEQLHGGGHLIGRLRLSATDSSRAASGRAVPEAVAGLLGKPAADRSEQDRVELARFAALSRVAAVLEALPPPQWVYAAAAEFEPEGNHKPAGGCRPVYVLRRGDVSSPVAPAVPGALACVPGLPAEFALADPEDEGQRRAALARWLADQRNVLTWRCIVNRVWHYHFGRGLVQTPNDLGHQGGPPSHPELLDWLADWFRQHGSLKQLHRLLVTSATYRQSSRHRADGALVDGDNVYLWRMNRTRLDAECVRDAVLAVTGRLDLQMGGPSAKQFVEGPGVHVTPTVDYAHFDVDSPAARRRSVYRFIFRTLPDPFMDSLDCADANQLTPTRNTSVTVLQALSMLNNRFMVRAAEHFADRVAAMAEDTRGQIAAAWELALGRPPTEREAAALASYASRHGLANACRLLLNSNEFLFIP